MTLFRAHCFEVAREMFSPGAVVRRTAIVCALRAGRGAMPHHAGIGVARALARKARAEFRMACEIPVDGWVGGA